MDLTSITPSPQQMKALTHPVRVRMLGMLRIDGPATATTLADRLGLNTGATSYHLRQLAQAGFVVEDHRARQRPRPLVEGRAPDHDHRHRRSGRPGGPRHPGRLPAVGRRRDDRAAPALGRGAAAAARGVAGRDDVQRLGGAADPAPGPGADRAAGREHEGDRRGGRRRGRAVRLPAQRLPLPGQGRGRRSPSEQLAAPALRLADRRGDLAHRHPGVDDRAAVVRAGHDRQRHQDRPGRARRDAPAGRAQGARRSGDRPGRRPAGGDHLRPALGARGRRDPAAARRRPAARSALFLLLVALAGALRGPGDAAKDALVAGDRAPRPASRWSAPPGCTARSSGPSAMLGAAVAGRLVAVVGRGRRARRRRRSASGSPRPCWRGPRRRWSRSVPHRARRRPTGVERTSYRHQLREGWDFLRARPGAARHRGDGRADQPARPGVRRGAGAGVGAATPAAARP